MNSHLVIYHLSAIGTHVTVALKVDYSLAVRTNISPLAFVVLKGDAGKSCAFVCRSIEISVLHIKYKLVLFSKPVKRFAHRRNVIKTIVRLFHVSFTYHNSLFAGVFFALFFVSVLYIDLFLIAVPVIFR